MDQIDYDNLMFTLRGTWDILTDASNYGIMDQNSLYLLIGIGGMFVFAAIGYVYALNQSPKKFVKVRKWVRH